MDLDQASFDLFSGRQGNRRGDRLAAAAPAASGHPHHPGGLQRPRVGDARREPLEIAGRRVATRAVGGEILLPGSRVADQRVGQRSLARRRRALRTTGGLDAVEILRDRLDVLVRHRNGRHAAFGASALDDRQDQFAGLIVEHELRSQKVGTAELAAPRVNAVAGAADGGIQRFTALDQRRISGRPLLRRKRGDAAHARVPARVRQPAPPAAGRALPEPAAPRRCRATSRRPPPRPLELAQFASLTSTGVRGSGVRGSGSGSGVRGSGLTNLQRDFTSWIAVNPEAATRT